jgi:hypothetical protein
MSGGCQDCQRLVLWARRLNGRVIPLDPGPDPGGRWAVERDGDRRYLLPAARRLKKGEEPRAGEWRGVAHYTTCPARGAKVTVTRKAT